MKFKRGYKRDKKTIEWKTPKYIQEEHARTSSKWFSKKKFPCKKAKGQHDFFVYKEELLKWWKPTQKWIEYRCKLCGKKKFDYENI